MWDYLGLFCQLVLDLFAKTRTSAKGPKPREDQAKNSAGSLDFHGTSLVYLKMRHCSNIL